MIIPVAKVNLLMPSDTNASIIHDLSTQEKLSLPRVYGWNGYTSIHNILSPSRSNGPHANIVAALEHFGTATVDPALLTSSQTGAGGL